jgi:CheY-like chemotaxis protein
MFELRPSSVAVNSEDLVSESSKTVLVVDDNPAIRKRLRSAFISNGFKTCTEAPDGEVAIQLAFRVRPDLITLDLSMPDMNGLEAASRLRSLLPKTPIILLTLYPTDIVRTQTSRAGVDMVLSKTDDVATVVRKAHELLRLDRNRTASIEAPMESKRRGPAQSL